MRQCALNTKQEYQMRTGGIAAGGYLSSFSGNNVFGEMFHSVCMGVVL